MPIHRHENSILKSPIRAVITYSDDDYGVLGPHFDIQQQNYATTEMPLHKLADFLNDATGKNGGNCTISEEVANSILEDFSGVLKIEEDRYIYFGPKSSMQEEKKISTTSSTSSFFHPPQTEEKLSRYTGILPENVILPDFKAGTKVLDVGAGDGYMTARLRDELGCDAYALEPNIEVKEGYASCVKRLGEDHAFNLTLQDAVDQYPEHFIGQWDAITVFKYNIPGDIKDDFAKQLAACLKSDGVLFITSVEEDRVRYNSSTGGQPFIMDSLKRYFNSVQLRDVDTAGYRYGVVECTGPKQELTHQKRPS